MPRFPGLPEKPHYNSVKAYLSYLAKDIAEIVVDPVKMECFRKQLKKYAEFWQKWKTFEKADQKGCWRPEMGRPECIFNIFSYSYNLLKGIEKEAKKLAGSYALCALIHDSQLPHLDKINTDIILVEAVEETLSAPRNMLESSFTSLVDAEIYLIEEFYNRVTVDLQEFCKSEENKLTQESIEGQIQRASQLSDEEFLELTAKKFEERAKKVLSKDETWHDLDRSLRGWFDAAIERLRELDISEGEIGLFKYLYKNLLHYTRNINIKSFRGFPDSRIKQLASNQASELAVKFKDFAQRVKVFLKDAKAEIPAISKENEFGTIVELLRKDYWLENEDNLKQEIAKVSQDFINRGLYNSTVCTGKQLQVHFDHLENLFNYIIESLKKDFADIPLSNFKEKLFTIVDEEYKKSIPLAYSHLIRVGLAQKNTLKCFEQQVNKKRDKTKQAIETKFAIFEKQKAVSKDKRRPEGTAKETSPTKYSRTSIRFKEYLNKNYIRATIKHLPYFGPYLYDVIYGVDGANISKKGGEIPEKREEGPIDRKSLNYKHAIPKKENKPLYRKAWVIIVAISIVLGIIWTLIQIYESETFKNLFTQPIIKEGHLPKQTPLAEEIRFPETITVNSKQSLPKKEPTKEPEPLKEVPPAVNDKPVTTPKAPWAAREIRETVSAAGTALRGETTSDRVRSVKALLSYLPEDLNAREIVLLAGSETTSHREQILELLVKRTKSRSLDPEDIPLVLGSETTSNRVKCIRIIAPYIRPPITGKQAAAILGSETYTHRVGCLRPIAPLLQRPLSKSEVTSILRSTSTSDRSEAIKILFGQAKDE